jgi:hypothetical protein
MTFDNAASRLHVILEKAIEVNPNSNCGSVWMQLLEAKDDEELLAKLAAVMQLPAQTALLLTAHHPLQARSIEQWRQPIVFGFKSMQLDGTWNTFRGHLNPSVVSQVGLIGELLHTSMPFQTLKEDEISVVVEKLNAAMAAVKDSSLGGALKRYIVVELHALIQSLRDYRISGAMPVLRQVEAMNFHSGVDSEYKSFLTDHEIGRQVYEGIGAAAGLLTIVSGGYASIEIVAKFLLGNG